MFELMSAQSNLASIGDFVVSEYNAAKRYDYVVSCFEPIGKVHGGIGSYTRLLLETPFEGNILLISGTNEVDFYQDLVKSNKHISVVVLDREIYIGRNTAILLGMFTINSRSTS